MIKPYDEAHKISFCKKKKKILQSSKWGNLSSICLYNKPHYKSGKELETQISLFEFLL